MHFRPAHFIECTPVNAAKNHCKTRHCHTNQWVANVFVEAAGWHLKKTAHQDTHKQLTSNLMNGDPEHHIPGIVKFCFSPFDVHDLLIFC